jgi:hypothetical protein
VVIDPYEDALGRLRGLFAALPETSEKLSHGFPTFFVRTKVVAYLHDDHHSDGRLAIWVAAPEGVQAQVMAAEPERFFRPPYVGHRGWVGLRLDVAPDWDEIARIVVDSYRCVAPPALVRQLGS